MQLLKLNEKSEVVPAFEAIEEFAPYSRLIDALKRSEHSASVLQDAANETLTINWFLRDQQGQIQSVNLLTIGNDENTEPDILFRSLQSPEVMGPDHPVHEVVRLLHEEIENCARSMAVRASSAHDLLQLDREIKGLGNMIRRYNEAIRILNFPINPPAEPAPA